jgi:hypothetical protein
MEDAPELLLVQELLDHRHCGNAPVVVPDGVRHAGLLDGGHHLQRFLRVAAERLLAHHHLAGLRRGDRDLAVRIVRARDVDDVDVPPRDEIAPVRVIRLVAPVRRERLHALFFPRGDRFQRGFPRQIEKPWRLKERIRVRPPHEAVPYETDVQMFHLFSQRRR